jgi:hypothetical protein
MPDLAGSSGDSSTNSIDVKGDRNQVVLDNSGILIGNIEGNFNLNQQLQLNR